MERPILIDGEREEHTNGVEMNDGIEYMGIVNVIRLGEATSNQTSLVTCNGTIKMIFEVEDPLARDNLVIRQMGNQGPSPSRNQVLGFKVDKLSEILIKISM